MQILKCNGKKILKIFNRFFYGPQRGQAAQVEKHQSTVRREAPHMKVKRLNLPYKQVRLHRTVQRCFSYAQCGAKRRT
jgi:hypothetical protein